MQYKKIFEDIERIFEKGFKELCFFYPEDKMDEFRDK